MKKSVEQKIKDIVDAMGVHYVFESWHRANVEIDRRQRTKELKFPLCINILPVSGNLNWKKNGQITDAPNCLIAFGDKIALDFKSDQVQTIVEKLKGIGMQFIERVNKGGVFEPVAGQVRYSVSYDKLDANLVIVTFEIQLKELQGECSETVISKDFK